MKRITLLPLSLALVLLAPGCSKESRSQVGDTPSRAKSKAIQVEAQRQVEILEGVAGQTRNASLGYAAHPMGRQ